MLGSHKTKQPPGKTKHHGILNNQKDSWDGCWKEKKIEN